MEEKKQESNALTTALPVTRVLAMLASLFFTHSLPYQDERPMARPMQTRYAAGITGVRVNLGYKITDVIRFRALPVFIA